MISRFIESKYFFQLIIFILIFFYVFELNFYRHWSTIWDQDLILLHNSLLLNSGIKAEYHDHPGHTQILFISLWINFLDLINIIKFSSYNDLKNILITEKNFFELVKFYRFINLFSLILFSYSFYNISKIITKKKLLSYLLTILFITSLPILDSISHVRTELLSAGLIFLSLLFLLKLIDGNELKRKNIFFCGLAFILSIFCKFQSIFILLLFPLCFFFIQKKKIKMNLNFYENKNIHIYLSYLYLFGIFLIWLKYVKGLNYFIFPVIAIYFYLFINYLKNRFFRQKNFNIIFIHYFLLGSIISFIILILFKPFHTNNLSMIINFFGASSMFVQGSDLYKFNTHEIIKLILISSKTIFNYLKITFIKNSFTELLLFCVTSLLVIKNKKLHKDIKNFFKIVIFLLIVIFLFSVRPKYEYTIYFFPIIYFYFNYIAAFIGNSKILNTFIILLICTNIFSNMNYIKFNKHITAKDKICSDATLNKTNFFIDKMRLDIFTKICKK